MRCAGGFLGNKGDRPRMRRRIEGRDPMLNDSISSVSFFSGPRHLFFFYAFACMRLCALFYFLGARLEGRPDGYSGLQDDQLLLLSLPCSHRSVTTVQDDAHQARHTLSVDRLVVLLSVVWLVSVPRLLVPVPTGDGDRGQWVSREQRTDEDPIFIWLCAVHSTCSLWRR